MKSLSKSNVYLASLGIFLGASSLTLLAASSFTPAENSNAENLAFTLNSAGYYVNVYASKNLSLNLNTTVEGATAVAKDTIITKTNSPFGYRLFLSMDCSSDYDSAHPGNALYKDGDSTSSYFISPATGTFSAPSTLTANTWGYQFSEDDTAPTTYSAVPLAGNEQLIQQTTSANEEGITKDIYYGVLANISLPSGTYTGTVAYTALVDASSTDISVSPNITTNYSTGETIRIATPLYTNIEDVGTVTVKVGDDDCTDVSAELSSGAVVISCTAPAKELDYTTAYDVVVNIPKFGKTYTATEGLTYRKDFWSITYMQEMNGTICTNATTPSSAIINTTTTQDYAIAHSDIDGSHAGDDSYVPQHTLYDIRDNNPYRVRKLADGNCWMTENLRLTFDEDTELTPEDTDVVESWMPGVATEMTETRTKWDPDDTTSQEVTDVVHSYNGLNNKNATTVATKDGETQEIGAYYNFYTATATSGRWGMTANSDGEAEYSICPKGWVLPLGDAAEKSYKYLFEQTYEFGTDANGSVALQKFPISIIFAGSYSAGNGAIGGTDSRVEIWTRTLGTTGYSARELLANSTEVGTATSGRMRQGRIVRCVAR